MGCSIHPDLQNRQERTFSAISNLCQRVCSQKSLEKAGTMVAEYLRGMRGYDLLSFFDFFLAFAFYNGIVYVRVFSDGFSTHKKSKKSYMVMIGIQTGEEAAR